MAGPQFTADGARRVRAAVLAYEKSPRNASIPPRARYPVMSGGAGFGGLYPAVVGNGGISAAGSIGSPGTGLATLYLYDQTTPTASDEVTVKNPFKVAIAATSTVVVGQTRTGAWVLVSAECG